MLATHDLCHAIRIVRDRSHAANSYARENTTAFANCRADRKRPSSARKNCSTTRRRRAPSTPSRVRSPATCCGREFASTPSRRDPCGHRSIPPTATRKTSRSSVQRRVGNVRRSRRKSRRPTFTSRRGCARVSLPASCCQSSDSRRRAAENRCILQCVQPAAMRGARRRRAKRNVACQRSLLASRGQFDRDEQSVRRIRADVERAAVFSHDLARQRNAQSHAAACAFRRVERRQPL